MDDTHFDRVTDALTARLDALLRDNHALTRSLDAERDESARLLAAIGRVEGENVAMREELAAGRAANEQLAALSSRIDGLADQVARWTGSAAPADLSTPAVHGGRDEAAERLHAVLTSRSWRMTRPIRGLGRVMRRIRG